jgi:hypothetical protein
MEYKRCRDCECCKDVPPIESDLYEKYKRTRKLLHKTVDEINGELTQTIIILSRK